MAECCNKNPKITDIKRSQQLTRRATREATRAANSQGTQARAVLVKPKIKKSAVKAVKPCCGGKIKTGRLVKPRRR